MIVANFFSNIVQDQDKISPKPNFRPSSKHVLPDQETSLSEINENILLGKLNIK